MAAVVVVVAVEVVAAAAEVADVVFAGLLEPVPLEHQVGK